MEKKSINLLHIEDNTMQSVTVQALLKASSAAHFEYHTTNTLADGLKSIVSGAYDLILTDLQLPDGYGFSTFELVQEHAYHLPIVLLTNIDDIHLAQQAIQHGAQDYLIKSQLDARVLGMRLLFALERHHLMSEMRYQYEKRIHDLSS